MKKGQLDNVQAQPYLTQILCRVEALAEDFRRRHDKLERVVTHRLDDLGRAHEDQESNAAKFESFGHNMQSSLILKSPPLSLEKQQVKQYSKTFVDQANEEQES